MKQVTIIVVCLLAFSSCGDMLKEVPKAFVSRENYYKNEADAEGAITGAYAILGPNYYASMDCFIMEELHNDYAEGRGSQAPVSIVDRVLDNTNIGRASNYWGQMYNSINRCNAVLGNIPNITDINPNVQKRILAEAYFLRAFAYFNLVRFFGPVPLRLKENTDLSELSMPREPEDKVYAQIIEDALKAEADLPETVVATGHASKWAAK
ncbi:MAG: RagB/SusD family nutrient uptake outer membrane protein, partial [Prevotella sp.]|nr:RagB/SusD family nutrient uptake outer membrane protein [Prevotella sp.]